MCEKFYRYKAECSQLNLAHWPETKNIKKKQKHKWQCPLSSVQVQDPWRQSRRNKSDYGGKDS